VASAATRRCSEGVGACPELDIESLRANVFFGTSALDHVLVKVAEVVSGVGRRVVKNLRGEE
jgi:hypothetical protein